VSNNTAFYPRIQVDTTNSGAVGQAGGVLLTETIAAAGLGPAMSAALSGWRKPLAVHDPAKVILDLAVTLALGGDCLADIALLRSEPGLYGRVASDPTVSRTITALAADAPAALAAIDTARAAGRARAWKLAGAHVPNEGASARSPLIVDLDATLVGSHSEKEQAVRRTRRASVFIRCGRSSTMARPGPVNRCQCGCDRVTPVPTPRPTTSPSSRTPLPNCPHTARANARTARS
jgi:Transposase DDE domain group 1